MSEAQKGVRVLSIILIVAGLLFTANGIVLIALSTANEAVFAQLNGSGQYLNAVTYDFYEAGWLVMAGSIILTANGVCDIICGILGLRGAKNAAQIGAFTVFAWILLIVSLFDVGMTIADTMFQGPQVSWSDWISAGISTVLAVLAIDFAVRVKKEDHLSAYQER